MPWDPVWEEIFRNSEWGRYPPERVVRFIARNFYRAADRSKVRLLDLGAGPGACTWYMAREGFKVSAIDGSPAGIEGNRKALEEAGLSADLQTGDFRQLPWADNTFDGVIDNAAMYANPFAECGRIVGEVRRCLKPRGKFLSCSFTPRTWGFNLGREIEPGGFTDIPEGPFSGKGFCLFMSRPQIEELFSAFEKVTIDTEAMTVNGGEKLIEHWVVTCTSSA